MSTVSPFDPSGRFGPFGGAFVPETLVAPLEELCTQWDLAWADASFRAELDELLASWAGRPSSPNGWRVPSSCAGVSSWSLAPGMWARTRQS